MRSGRRELWSRDCPHRSVCSQGGTILDKTLQLRLYPARDFAGHANGAATKVARSPYANVMRGSLASAIQLVHTVRDGAPVAHEGRSAGLLFAMRRRRS